VHVQGTIRPMGDGSYAVDLAEATWGRSRWSVITLEPCVDQWLEQLDGPRQVELLGCFNPWGPWLRVSAVSP
jgi:hypothetical protein